MTFSPKPIKLLNRNILVKVDAFKEDIEINGIIRPMAAAEYFTTGKRYSVNTCVVLDTYEGCTIPIGARIRVHHLTFQSVRERWQAVEHDILVIEDPEFNPDIPPQNAPIYYYYKEDGTIQVRPGYLLGLPIYPSDAELKSESGLFTALGSDPVKGKTYITHVPEESGCFNVYDSEQRKWIHEVKVGDVVITQHKWPIEIAYNDNPDDRLILVWEDFVLAIDAPMTKEEQQTRATRYQKLTDEIAEINKGFRVAFEVPVNELTKHPTRKMFINK